MRPAAAPDRVSTLSWLIEATIFWVELVPRMQRAESYSPRMTHLSVSIVRPRSQVAVPVQQLTPSAAFKWIANAIADGGRRPAVVAKPLGRLGRLCVNPFRTRTQTAPC